MTIESNRVTVPAPPEKVFEFVSNLNNFHKLLPEERISEWESREDYCSFKVQGTATIDLELDSAEAPGKLLLKSGSRSPFPFTLDVTLETHPDGTEGWLVMNASVNPFLKMMVEKPLGNLFNFIAERLAKEVKK